MRKPFRRVRRRRHLLRLIVVLVVAGTVAFVIRQYLFVPYRVDSSAMEPTLQAGDQAVMVPWQPLAGPVQRGDIVIFQRPVHLTCNTTIAPGEQELVQRVIGMPGDTIWSRHGHIYVNGHRLADTDWYDPRYGEVGFTPIPRTKVPPASYFLLDDNRSDSCDSRSFGAIPATSIVGIVVATVVRHGYPHVHLFHSI